MSGVKQGKTGVPTKLRFLYSKIKGYRRFNMITYSLMSYDNTEVAKFRMKVISFHNQFGTKATLAAFPVKRSTIFLWKKTFRDSQGKLNSLIPKSTRPHNLRRSTIDLRIIKEIKRLREDCYSPGKKKLKPLLDNFCQANDLAPLAESTIGKVLRRNNYFKTKQINQSQPGYHTATGKYQRERGRKWKTKRKRVRYHPKPDHYGYIQMDTITKFVDGIKRYIITAIDVKLKFSFSLMYPKLNSRNAKDFFIKFQQVYPLTVKAVQTDNGLEFLREFDKYLKKQNISHFFTYPRCPKINGTVERFNRTLQDKFINPNLHLVHQPKLFNDKMIEYLLYYNGQRPHESLGQLSPLQYLVYNGLESKKTVAHTSIRELKT
jgi:IS30 family transposase